MNRINAHEDGQAGDAGGTGKKKSWRSARLAALALPPPRRLRTLWDEKKGVLSSERVGRLKGALETNYFMNPEQTEEYFRAMRGEHKATLREKRDACAQEMLRRQQWLVTFSAQIAYRLCDYIASGKREIVLANRLRSIADVVLERVAEVLGEKKPCRDDPNRLSRFMVAISDRIAVWIENALYKAEVDFDEDSGEEDNNCNDGLPNMRSIITSDLDMPRSSLKKYNIQ